MLWLERLLRMLVRTCPTSFRSAELSSVAFECFNTGKVVRTKGKLFGKASGLKLVTAKKPSQFVIGDVRPQHEIGIVVFKLFHRAVALASLVDDSQLVDQSFTELCPIMAYSQCGNVIVWHGRDPRRPNVIL